eukprot:comp19357_c0_seq1/m.36524 comp19357_c0_seq1/g.36524  ORF comp19357_c0_seq1/g.36524 comp19357_c0_seq1/m.36524 type:complete len:556 (-) comp19357_c0_seq1:660-2327(-)
MLARLGQRGHGHIELLLDWGAARRHFDLETVADKRVALALQHRELVALMHHKLLHAVGLHAVDAVLDLGRVLRHMLIGKRLETRSETLGRLLGLALKHRELVRDTKHSRINARNNIRGSRVNIRHKHVGLVLNRIAQHNSHLLDLRHILRNRHRGGIDRRTERKSLRGPRLGDLLVLASPDTNTRRELVGLRGNLLLRSRDDLHLLRGGGLDRSGVRSQLSKLLLHKRAHQLGELLNRALLNRLGRLCDHIGHVGDLGRLLAKERNLVLHHLCNPRRNAANRSRGLLLEGIDRGILGVGILRNQSAQLGQTLVVRVKEPAHLAEGLVDIRARSGHRLIHSRCARCDVLHQPSDLRRGVLGTSTRSLHHHGAVLRCLGHHRLDLCANARDLVDLGLGKRRDRLRKIGAGAPAVLRKALERLAQISKRSRRSLVEVLACLGVVKRNVLLAINLGKEPSNVRGGRLELANRLLAHIEQRRLHMGALGDDGLVVLDNFNGLCELNLGAVELRLCGRESVARLRVLALFAHQLGLLFREERLQDLKLRGLLEQVLLELLN